MPIKAIRTVGRALAASGSSAAITGLVVDWLTNALILSSAVLIVKMSPLATEGGGCHDDSRV
jgi:hypothetical protein